MSHRPRFLQLGSPAPVGAWPANADVVRAASWAEALVGLRRQPFDGIVADLTAPALLAELRSLDRAEALLAVVPDGVAVLDDRLRVRWANRTFRGWCEQDPAGREFHEALGSAEVSGSEGAPPPAQPE